MPRLSSQEVQALKDRFDARDIAQSILGNGKKRTNYINFMSPFRDDGNHPDFAVYSNGYMDYGSGERGDVLDLVMKTQKLSFPEAINWLQSSSVQSPVKSNSKSPNTSAGTSEPPSIEWQSEVRILLEKSQDYLWSGRPDAQSALAYLHSQTLDDEHIRSFGLGLNPRNQKFRDGVFPKGIVIPIEANDALYRISVRTDGKHKYQNVSGSKLCGLFNADTIQTGKPVVIVEGEKDAMVLQQALGDQAAVVTFGGVTSHVTMRWRQHLQKASLVYVCLDTDDAGRAASSKMTDKLKEWGIDAKQINVPKGKDVTEYAAYHHGDLRGWFERETRPIWWPNGVPDTVRRAFLRYFSPTYAPVHEMVNDANCRAMIDPQCFEMEELFHANRELGYNIPNNTIRDTLLREDAELIRELDPVLDTQPLASNSRINSSKRGRRPTQYRLVSTEEIQAKIIAWANPRIHEAAHSITPTNPTLSKMSSDMLRDVLSLEEDYDALANEFNLITTAQFEQQPRKKRFAGKMSRSQKQALIMSLEDTKSTPLPEGFPKSTAREYRAAFAHGIMLDQKEICLNREATCNLLGVSTGGLKQVLEDAAWETHEQFASATLNDATNLRNEIDQGAYDSRGYPSSVIVEQGDNHEKFGYHPGIVDQIKEYILQGATVTMIYQTANRYTLRNAESPTQPKLLKRAKASTRSGVLIVSERTKRFYGPQYNPEWVRAQFRLTLLAMGWRKRSRQLINPHTGEILDDNTPTNLLLEAILQRKLKT